MTVKLINQRPSIDACLFDYVRQNTNRIRQIAASKRILTEG